MTSDLQLLKLIDVLKQMKVIRFDNEFCEAIGLRKQNLVKIKAGRNHFTPEHIERAIKKYNINANWIFGTSERIFNDAKLSHKAVLRTGVSTKAYTKQLITKK